MKYRILSIAIAAALMGSTPVTQAGGFTAATPAAGDSTTQIIVRLAEYEGADADLGISAERFAQIEAAASVPLQRVRAMSGDARVLALPRAMDTRQVSAIAARIAALPGVKYAVADRIMRPQVQPADVITPSDPLYADQWHYFEAVGGINLPSAWSITTGDPALAVAVIDTGILDEHEDLAGRSAGGYDFIRLPFNSRDGDRRDPDPSDEGDWNRLYPSSWHGSHVAGTIGASTDNGIGVAGINWNSTIQPIRVLGRLGGFTSDIVDGMRWAVGMAVPGIPANTHPAKVLNMSLGGSGVCDAVYQDAVDDVLAMGSVLVVAAGNSNQPASSFTPASCNGVITVAATGRTGDKASYSNYGAAVEISAPGGDGSDGILSTLNTGTTVPAADAYAEYTGTSMASPHVAGVVSLMLSVNPSLTPAEVLAVLQSTARPFPAGTQCANNPTLCGAGIVDAHAAVMQVLPQ